MKVTPEGGAEIELGTTETGATIGIVDFSRRSTDEFGVTTVVERGFARRMSARVVLPFEDVDAVQQQLAALRATPALWTADDRFDWLSFEGFYKDFELDLAMPPVSYCTLTVEGLAETETVTDTGEDPAPDGSTSTLRLLQPVTITSGMLSASTVPENDYPEWSALATYDQGDRVIKAATHRVYESAAGQNLGNDPEGESGQWIDIGSTNRWAMFDQALGSATSGTSPLVVTIAPGEAAALALLDVTGSTIRVQTTGYDETVAVGPGAATFLDLPGAGDPITVTVTGAGTVAVGTLLAGALVTLGVTEASASAGINDFSRKQTDEFGEVTIVERAWSKRMSARATIRTDAVDIVANRIAAVRAVPSLWIGEQGLDSLTVYGFFKDFSIEVGETVSRLSLSIEGLAKAPPPAPLPSVGWVDVVDSEPVAHPKPEDGATVGAPPGTPVGDRPAEDVIDAIDGHTSALDQLDLDMAAAESQIAAAESHITNLLGDMSAAEAAILTAQGDIATNSSAIGTLNATVSTQATAISNLEGNYASLSSTVSTLGSTVSSNSTAISTLNSNYATLSSTVSTLSSSVSTQATAISNLEANYAGLTATVAASQPTLNADPGFDRYSSPSAFPDKWQYNSFVGGGSTVARSADPKGGFACTLNALGSQLAYMGQSLPGQIVPNAYYVIEVRAKLTSGSFRGAGVTFRTQPDGTGDVNLQLEFAVGVGTAGKTYSAAKLVQAPAGASADGVLYVVSHSPALGDIDFTEAFITWEYVGLRAATPAEIRDQTVLTPLEATVSTHSIALATLDSQYASLNSTVTTQGLTVSQHTTSINGMAGRWAVAIDSNGRVVGRVKLDGTGQTSSFDVTADAFRVINPSGGAGMSWTVDGSGRPTLLVDDGAGSTVEIGWLA